MNLSGKNICYVGGFGGIGLETCKCLLEKNIANLVILDLIENPEALNNLRTQNPRCEVSFMKIDITDKKSIESCMSAVVEKCKFIDILVNGAGVFNDRNVELTINVNLVGLINTTLITMPHMDKTKGGRGGMIVNVSSVLGIHPCPPHAVYSASKFGVIGFTRSLADPFYVNKTGINFMVVCPGLTNTELVKDPKSKTTFDCTEDMLDKFFKIESQEANVCGENIVKCIEKWQNGAIWLLQNGQLKLSEKHSF